MTAFWQANNAVQAILLTGRHGRLAQPNDLHGFQSLDCSVTLFSGDCSQAESAEGLKHCIENHGLPLNGVMHAAGIQVGLLLTFMSESCISIVVLDSR